MAITFRPRAGARNEGLYWRIYTARDGDEDGYLELPELLGGHADDDLDRAVLLHKPYEVEERERGYTKEKVT